MLNYTDPPASDQVSAATLARIFNDTTNSYKFLFFLAMLAKLEANRFDDSIRLEMREIVIEMLVLAWYPHVYFRLSFGSQDKIAVELDKIGGHELLDGKKLVPTDRERIRAFIAARLIPNDLHRFVPYRLLVPFFAQDDEPELKRSVENRIAEQSETYFDTKKPFYKFDQSRKNLLMHPLWCAYFERNIAVVRGWAWWNFLQYMQRRNPNVPAVSLKLMPPLERESLANEKRFWNAVLKVNPLTCIYSGAVLVDASVLDHFVPWSFVVHNQLWNLIPTSGPVNSSKSDKLPSAAYFDSFVSAQHTALICSRQSMENKDWQKFADSFIDGLAMPNYDSLCTLNELRHAYELRLLPLMQLAEANGFVPGWTL